MKSKLSEIEELRLKKNELIQECRLIEEDLKYRTSYAKSNVGSLLMNTIVSSAKNGFSDLFIPGSKKKKKESSKSSLGIGSILATSTPLIWEIVQPLLIGIAVKKAKSIFTRKKKK